MALKESNLNDIPQRIRDVVFGWTREEEKDNDQSIPRMVKCLCLLYFNSSIKEDKIAIGQGINYIKIKMDDKKCISIRGNERIVCYLENIAYHGIHIWIFCCNKLDVNDIIGIATTENKQEKRYGFQLKGKTRGFGGGRSIVRCMTGDIIKMTLDMNDFSLSYSVQGANFGKDYVISAKYRAFVRIKNNGCYQLLSYEHKL